MFLSLVAVVVYRPFELKNMIITSLLSHECMSVVVDCDVEDRHHTICDRDAWICDGLSIKGHV